MICDHAGRTVGAVPDDGDRTATAGSGVAVLHLQCPGQAGRAAVQDLAPGNPQGALRRRRPTPARTESSARHGPAVAGASGVCGRWNSCVKNFLQFPVGAETRPYGRVSARREIFGRFMPPPAMSRIPVRMREPRRSGHIDNAAPSATAHGSPPQVPRSDADRTPRSGRS